MKIKILGCGASGGVPLITGNWGKCNPENSYNLRTRTSLALSIEDQVWLIDMSPDLHVQCLRENISRIDGVLCTHAHFDHIGGLDEMKPFSVRQKQLLPIYSDKETLENLRYRYPYAFEHTSPPEGPLVYQPFVQGIEIQREFYIASEKVIPFFQDHRHSHSLGFRFVSWGYSTDVWELSDEAFQILEGIDVWIVDCLDVMPRETHVHLKKTLAWIERLRPKKTILIHMNHLLDYDVLKSQLPSDVVPAYDGMVLEGL